MQSIIGLASSMFGCPETKKDWDGRNSGDLVQFDEPR